MLRSSARLALRAGLQNKNVLRWEETWGEAGITAGGQASEQPWRFADGDQPAASLHRHKFGVEQRAEEAQEEDRLPGCWNPEAIDRIPLSDERGLLSSGVERDVHCTTGAIGSSTSQREQSKCRRQGQPIHSEMSFVSGYLLGGRSLSVLVGAISPGQKQLTNLRFFSTRSCQHSASTGNFSGGVHQQKQAGTDSSAQNALLQQMGTGGLTRELEARSREMAQLLKAKRARDALQLFDPGIANALDFANLPESAALLAEQLALRRAATFYFDIATNAASQLGDANLALHVVDTMKARGLKVGYVASGCVIRALCMTNRMQEAISYLSRLDSGQQTAAMYNTVLSSSVWRKDPALFEKCLRLMEERRVERDALTWTLTFRNQALHRNHKGIHEARQQLPKKFEEDLSVRSAYVLALLSCSTLDKTLQELKSLLALYAVANETSSTNADRLEDELELALQRLKLQSSWRGVDIEDQDLESQISVPMSPKRNAAGKAVTMAANKVMHAALRAQDLSIAQEAASALRESGAPLDVYTFSMLLQMVLAEGLPPQPAEDLLLEMDATGIEPSSQIFLFMLQAYARQGDIAGAESVMARIVTRGMQPVAHHFNTLLHMHLEAGSFEGMTEVFADMQASHVTPDAYTFSILFKGSCLVPHPWSGKQQGAALDEAQEAARVHKLVLNLEVVKEAMDDWLEDAQALGIPLAGPLLTSVVKALGHTDQRARMLEVLDTCLWQADWSKDPSEARATVNAAIAALARFGDVQGALDVRLRMEEEGMEPNGYTYTSLINACAQGRSPQQAHALLAEMRQRGMKPVVWTYNALIKAECIAGDLSRAAAVVDMMEENGCAPNYHTWEVLLQSAHSSSRADLAAAVEARQRGQEGMFSEMLKAETLAAFGAGFNDESDDEYLW